ncbi:hypothetical protein [Desulfobacter postgatei]|uniref:hypothetical protein n=1 Tax=Desulfobacter postgatei TaxID=2293 RepID=UPI00259BF2B4|nr:hypothetical protein [uncultured Desulfobacter sp.]
MQRYTDHELEALLNDTESDLAERKKSFKGDTPFDIYPVPSAKITDLSKTIFENEYLPSAFAADILEENNRSYEERLASCKMVVSPDDTTPTVLGLLSVALPAYAYFEFVLAGHADGGSKSSGRHNSGRP